MWDNTITHELSRKDDTIIANECADKHFHQS